MPSNIKDINMHTNADGLFVHKIYNICLESRLLTLHIYKDSFLYPSITMFHDFNSWRTIFRLYSFTLARENLNFSMTSSPIWQFQHHSLKFRDWHFCDLDRSVYTVFHIFDTIFVVYHCGVANVRLRLRLCLNWHDFVMNGLKFELGFSALHLTTRFNIIYVYLTRSNCEQNNIEMCVFTITKKFTS